MCVYVNKIQYINKRARKFSKKNNLVLQNWVSSTCQDLNGCLKELSWIENLKKMNNKLNGKHDKMLRQPEFLIWPQPNCGFKF